MGGTNGDTASDLDVPSNGGKAPAEDTNDAQPPQEPPQDDTSNGKGTGGGRRRMIPNQDAQPPKQQESEDKSGKGSKNTGYAGDLDASTGKGKGVFGKASNSKSAKPTD